MDSKLFNAVFGAANPKTLCGLLTDDFEFYHDRNGLASDTADKFIKSIQRNREPGMERRVIADSVKVYPLKGFGAIQEGMHEFYISKNSDKPKLASVARFMHIWQKTKQGWKLKREFSFDHKD